MLNGTYEKKNQILYIYIIEVIFTILEVVSSISVSVRDC